MADTNKQGPLYSLRKKIKKLFYSSQAYLDTNGVCPTKDIMAVTLDKWSLFCMYNLGFYGTMRFNELKSKIDGVSSRMLSVTLKRLEQHKVVTRKVYAEVPPRVEYDLTTFGSEWAAKVIDLTNWFVENHEMKVHEKVK